MVEKNSDTIDEEKVREHVEEQFASNVGVFEIKSCNGVLIVIIESEKDRVPLVHERDLENFTVTNILSNIKKRTVYLESEYDELPDKFFDTEPEYDKWIHGVAYTPCEDERDQHIYTPVEELDVIFHRDDLTVLSNVRNGTEFIWETFSSEHGDEYDYGLYVDKVETIDFDEVPEQYRDV